MNQVDKTTPIAQEPVEQLPSMAYRSWFLFIIMLVSTSVVAERGMMAVMVGPIKADLHLSDFSIGLAKDMAIAIVYVLAVIPLSRLGDRWQKRKVVALAIATWSVAVLLCGSAKNFAMLLIGRSGIGLGEGGFTPPSQSWIADLFPMRQRATALSIFLVGASLGQFAGPVFGGKLATEYGWQKAMMLMSIPGFILLPIVWFTLRDTRPGLADGTTVDALKQKPFMETVREILSIKTLPLLMIAAALNALLTAGMIGWAPAFMERSHGMPMQEAGKQMGLALLLGSFIGHSLGGPLSDFLGRRDMRWYIWMMMMSGLMATVVGWLTLSVSQEYVFPLFGLNLLVGGLSAAPLMAVVSGLAPAHSRSTAIALLMVIINTIGLGGGPTFIGWLSDMLHPYYGQESLAMAMRWVLVIGVPSFLLALAASRTCVADFAASGSWTNAKRGTVALH